uniref:Uncharacterized protein n=1 Tax=viral metagenome TaxID=1070528 RepID=A0A6C0BZV3_9ZZZZ
MADFVFERDFAPVGFHTQRTSENLCLLYRERRPKNCVSCKNLAQGMNASVCSFNFL